MIIIGIDPGTRTCGYSRINYSTRRIYQSEAVHSHFKDPTNRIIQISKQILDLVDCPGFPPPDYIFLETTHFRQNRDVNDMYQRLVGGIIASLGTAGYPQIDFVQNTTMKKLIGGHGKAEKDQVAGGVAKWAGPVTGSFKIVRELFDSEQWDVTDALAIAIAGGMQHE